MNKQETDIFNLMFERLSEQLTCIQKQLTKQNSQEPSKPVDSDINSIKDIAIKISKNYEKLSISLGNGMIALINQNRQILKKTEDYNIELLSLKAKTEAPEEKRCLKIDLKSLKTLSIFIAFGLSFLLSIIININLMRQNEQMKDNDLKYQIIKENNGINKSELAELEHLFYPERNKKAIKQIKKSLSK
jgi:hypothetical protein